MASVSYSKEALETLSKRLNAFDIFNDHSFELKKMMKAPVCDRHNRYRTEGLLDGEIFRFANTYVGKSNRLIFKFKPLKAKTYRYMELDQSKIYEAFPAFSDLIDNMLGADIDSYLKDYSSVYEEKERKEELVKKQEQYGSAWGMF